MSGYNVGMDEIDRAAAKEGNAIRWFRGNYTLARPDTKAVAKRGLLRGAKGAAQRKGMLKVAK